MVYSIELLEEIFSKLKWENEENGVYCEAIKFIKKITENKKINNIYPKNMFVEGKDIELYTFTHNCIFVTKPDTESKDYVSTSIMKIKDIKTFEKIEKNEYTPISLKIYFYDGEEIILKSDVDTNSHHEHKYRSMINEIITLLLERAFD